MSLLSHVATLEVEGVETWATPEDILSSKPLDSFVLEHHRKTPRVLCKRGPDPCVVTDSSFRRDNRPSGRLVATVGAFSPEGCEDLASPLGYLLYDQPGFTMVATLATDQEEVFSDRSNSSSKACEELPRKHWRCGSVWMHQPRVQASSRATLITLPSQHLRGLGDKVLDNLRSLSRGSSSCAPFSFSVFVAGAVSRLVVLAAAIGAPRCHPHSVSLLPFERLDQSFHTFLPRFTEELGEPDEHLTKPCL